MDLPFTPDDDRPRSTPEPLQSYHRHEQTVATVAVSVVHPTDGHLSDNERLVTADIPMVMVHPGDGQLSDSDRDATADAGGEDRGRPGIRDSIPGALGSLSSDGVEEREDSGRPNSAPARTPTTAGPVVMDAGEPRSRVIHPHLPSLSAQHLETTNMGASSNPSSRLDQNVSPDDLDSSDHREGATPVRYSEMSSGPSGEPQYECHFCRFCSPSLTQMQEHLAQHTGEKLLFRRHRRQHQRSNPTSMLHCDKCQFSTLAPRRMREHYSFQHNQDFGASARAASMFLRTSSFTNPTYNRVNTGSSADGGYYLDLSGSRSLGSYRLSQPRGSGQFEPGEPSSTINSGSVNGGFVQPAGLPGFRNHSERVAPNALFPPNTAHLTLEYLFGHPRVSASSTITSCEYPARPANPHRPDLNNYSPLRGSTSTARDVFSRQSTASPHRTRSMSLPQGEGVKVKREPMDCDGVSDVTSSGVPGLFERERGGPDQDRPRRRAVPETTTSTPRHQRPLFEPLLPCRLAMEQSDEIATSADVSRVSQSSEAASSHLDTGGGSAEDSEQEERRGSMGGGDSLGHHLLYNIKAETSSVAVQCSGTCSMKSESLPSVVVAAAEHSTESRRSHHLVTERGVQCELLSSTSARRLTSRTLSTDSEQQSVSGSDTRCSHCGITFDDEVLFSIHIGCHSHTDPFVCNVCGKKCQNKYGFYSHIMRGHHF